ncbi:hypothetical protein ONE63_010202 [Megalurothrips usitatus]|uniref:Uncharacterized protein n=1 Tax=Megalurothrips usitatus TaxID=439358 RepID=A0AAV7XH27_9NEOP|nr:hypothetical protein ONE63_010202 [Megalurothrips usitatus]
MEEVWATLCSCWPNNLKVIIRYLLIVSGMAPNELLPFVSGGLFILFFFPFSPSFWLQDGGGRRGAAPPPRPISASPSGRGTRHRTPGTARLDVPVGGRCRYREGGCRRAHTARTAVQGRCRNGLGPRL